MSDYSLLNVLFNSLWGGIRLEESIVSIQDVAHSFGSEVVIRQVNLDIAKGEIFGLLGPSGAGKTTLVKMIVGMLKPMQGKVVVQGVTMPSLKQMRNMGYMAQSDALYEELTAYENLDFFGQIFGLSTKERKKNMDEAVSLVNLTDHLHKPVEAFSGGMKRRMSLAAALLHQPDVLILDEPTVGIDPVLRQSIWAELHQLKNQGKTIIVTTHVMDEADKCDRLALLRDGYVIAEGTPVDVEAYHPSVAVIDAPPPLTAQLLEREANVIIDMSLQEAEQALINKEIDAYLQGGPGKLVLKLEGSDPAASGAVMRVLQQSLLSLNSGQGMELETSFLHGSGELGLYDSIGPVLIGFFIFFFIFLLGGVSFLRERTQGTLERLLSTPIKRWEIVVGYLCGFGLFTILQSILIAAFAIYVLQIYMAGSFVYVLLVTFLLALTALSLGTMLSAFAKTEFQIIQFIPIVIIPQVFFSGIFQLETMGPLVACNWKSDATHLWRRSAERNYDQRSRNFCFSKSSICVDRVLSRFRFPQHIGIEAASSIIIDVTIKKESDTK